MFSYNMLPDPNMDHTGFQIILAINIILFGLALFGMERKEFNSYWPLWVLLLSLLGFGYYVSYSEWNIPDNKPYRAKFIQFVAEREKHTGPKGQVSYSNAVYCEYKLEINNSRILIPCNSKQSPEYVTVYWNKK